MSAVEHVQPQSAVPAVLTSDQRHLEVLWRQANRLANSDLVPKELRGKPDNVMAVILYGATYELESASAVQHIWIINGRLTPSAQVLAGAAMRQGYEVEYDEIGSDRCVVAIRRAGSETWKRLTYTIEDARRAGSQDVWVEQWVSVGGRNKKQTWVVGPTDSENYVDGPVPEWAQKLIDAGQRQRKDPWFLHTMDMLAHATMRKAVRFFAPDVVLRFAEVEDDDGVPVEQVLAETRPAQPDRPADPDDEPVDAEIVDDDQPVEVDGGGEDDDPPTAVRDVEPEEVEAAPAASSAHVPPTPPPASPTAAEPLGMTQGQSRALHAELREHGVVGPGRHAAATRFFGREISSLNEISAAEASSWIDALKAEREGRVTS